MSFNFSSSFSNAAETPMTFANLQIQSTTKSAHMTSPKHTPTPTPKLTPKPTPKPSAVPTPTPFITLLVNKSHPLPKNFKTSNLVLIRSSVPVRFPNLKLNYKALLALEKMNKAVKAAKTNIYIWSGYRTYAEQKKLYDDKIEFYEKTHSHKEAVELASKLVAPPNTSEHQTGLAIDIVSTGYRSRDIGFASSTAGKWLAKNSWKYGYILRYAYSKQKITKYNFEPWHFRYVGIARAKAVFKSGLCYEEYLAKH